MDTVSKASYRLLPSESKSMGLAASADQRLQQGGSSVKNRYVRWTVASCNLWGHAVQINRSTFSHRAVECARPDTPPPDTTEISEADFMRRDESPRPVGEWVREMEDPSTQKLPLYGILSSAHERFCTAPDMQHANEIAVHARDALFAGFAPVLQADNDQILGWTDHDVTLLRNSFAAVHRYFEVVGVKPPLHRDSLFLGISSLTFHEYANNVTYEGDVRAWVKLLHSLHKADPLGDVDIARDMLDLLIRQAKGPSGTESDEVSNSAVAVSVKQQRHDFVKAQLNAHLPSVLVDIVSNYSDFPPVGGVPSYWIDDLLVTNAAVVPAPARSPTPKEDVQASAELTVDGRVCPVFVMDRKSDAKGRYRVGVSLDREAENLMERGQFEAIWDDALSFPPKQFWVPKEFLE